MQAEKMVAFDHDKFERIVAFEGLRGLAAIVVVVWHTMLAFNPQCTVGFCMFDPTESFLESVFFVFMNGTAAVVLFFVLSGFVLSRKAFMLESRVEILRNAIKRYPRLMLPVLISVLFSWTLFYLDLFSFEEAAAISKSPWLEKFGGVHEVPFKTSIFAAVQQGVFYTFFRGDNSYNFSLWTMRLEMCGSFIIFGATFLLIEIKHKEIMLKLYVFFIIYMLADFASSVYTTFVVGAALAYILPPRNRWQFSLPARSVSLVLGLYFLGFSQPIGVYVIFSGYSFLVLNTLGACLVIASLYYGNPGYKLNAIYKFLGGLSFPLYLIHGPVIFSLGCSIYLYFFNKSIQTQLMMIPLCILISIFAAIPLMWINNMWLAYLNRRIQI